MALGRLASTTTVDTGDRAGAEHLSVFGHHLAFLVVLRPGVLSSANGADDHVLQTRAALRLMSKHPAAITLGDEGARLVLTGFSGSVPKKEWWVTHDVLKTRPIGVKESNGDGAMASVRMSGRQPEGVSKHD